VVTESPFEPATPPPQGLDGLDPSWSRIVETPTLDGVGRSWHVLDNGIVGPHVTLLCVHGNPTWSYVWRSLLAAAPAGVRVVAVDQLDMGFSERTGTVRRLHTRIADLGALTDALGLDGPVVTVAHDWGGPISIGWAARHREQLAGMVLMNTAVHQPEGARAPSLIRAVRRKGVLDTVAVSTTGFIRGALALGRPQLDPAVRRAYLAPYGTTERRRAIGTFVRDIPLEPDHPSMAALYDVAASLDTMADIPVLLLWGPSEPVFSDLYLHDLEARLPHADVHRFIGASHLLPEDADVATPVHAWVATLGREEPTRVRIEPGDRAWSALDRRANDAEVAVVEMGPDGATGSVTFRDLHDDVDRVAAGLVAYGVAAGDRVALLVPPGIELTTCLYACWRMGAVVVVADAGLGVRGMGTAMRSADPDWIIGIPKALAAARVLRWPGRRILVQPASSGAMRTAMPRTVGAEVTVDGLRGLGEGTTPPDPPGRDTAAAVAFTSGATGPAKGVAYRHEQLESQHRALVEAYGITTDDRLVAAFAPFSLFGPAMGIPSAVPHMDVTAPSTLTAQALADAVAAIDATLVFASPSALANVVATSSALDADQRAALAGVRLLMSAGAPVPVEILRQCREVMPNAEAHTPYGMTEALPVADADLDLIEDAGPGRGVCVGVPLPGVEVTIAPIGRGGWASGDLTDDADVLGEVCIRAAHVKERYDRLWATDHLASTPPGWHRSGDLGRFDGRGRLWIEGRVVHAIHTAHGPVTPLPLEQRFRTAPSVTAAAAVGVGPVGDQRIVAIVVPAQPPRTGRLASPSLAGAVRATVDEDVVAVLEVPSLPVDIRHNAKVDRTRLARWAGRVLAGRRTGRP
jgi:acyl-coenzyme A synthetase/AMP-(fatty) acid ligase/pimeloyl-ACP methyl ester carboxylesterase